MEVTKTSYRELCVSQMGTLASRDKYVIWFFCIIVTETISKAALPVIARFLSLKSPHQLPAVSLDWLHEQHLAWDPTFHAIPLFERHLPQLLKCDQKEVYWQQFPEQRPAVVPGVKENQTGFIQRPNFYANDTWRHGGPLWVWVHLLTQCKAKPARALQAFSALAFLTVQLESRQPV